MFQKASNGKKWALRKFVLSAGVTTAVANTMLLPLAAPIAGDPKEIIQALLSGLFGIAQWIGVLLLAWGVISLVLAIKNEDADSKTRSIMSIVVAIALICLGTIFGAVLTKIGFTATPAG